ncbi:MAG: hypothetical protein LLF75_08130 [Eubacteriales bacterium]|nr:hypothetical protein [Eubacteriales bacterium]
MAKSTQEIASRLKSVRFRRCAFGGVDEDDVWAKFERLNEEYAELLEIKQQRAKGAVNAWKEYALQLEAEIREKDEQLRLLTERRSQPERAALPEETPSVLQKDASAMYPATPGKGAWPQRAGPTRHVCSAEQVRRMYSGKGTGPVSRYG